MRVTGVLLGVIQVVLFAPMTAGISSLMPSNIHGRVPKVKSSTTQVSELISMLRLKDNCEGLKDCLNLRLRGGAKSKNHTNHNQNAKAHRNGIKRVKT
jgi:hypothetical protein